MSARLRIVTTLLLVLLFATPVAAFPMCGMDRGWLATCAAGTIIYDATAGASVIDLGDNRERIFADNFFGTVTVTLGTPVVEPNWIMAPIDVTADLHTADGKVRLEVFSFPWATISMSPSDSAFRFAAWPTVRFTHPTFGVLDGFTSYFESTSSRSLPFETPALYLDTLYFPGTRYEAPGVITIGLTNPRDPVRVPEPSTLVLAALGVGVVAIGMSRSR